MEYYPSDRIITDVGTAAVYGEKPADQRPWSTSPAVRNIKKRNERKQGFTFLNQDLLALMETGHSMAEIDRMDICAYIKGCWRGNHNKTLRQWTGLLTMCCRS